MSLIADECFELSTMGSVTTIQALPYSSSRILNCKQRWREKTLYEIFHTEYKLDQTYVTTACLEGRIMINMNPCQYDTVIHNGDKIFHSWIAMEPPVSTKFLPHILVQSTRHACAYKPSGLPTVPQGKFFRTNLVSMVKISRGWWVQPINRLDRPVAGLVVMSIDPMAVIKVTRKVYIAKVRGHFPSDLKESNAKLFLEKHVENQVLKTLIDPQRGSDALTRFRLLSHIADGYSFVEAVPVTGRTHQIRAHLAGLGYPIVGDLVYDGSESDLMKQPDEICLLSYAYSFTVDNGPEETVTLSRECLPDWWLQDSTSNS
jgi:23S rRNA-/tRNA-specific pseudouridylate synthase